MSLDFSHGIRKNVLVLTFAPNKSTHKCPAENLRVSRDKTSSYKQDLRNS